MNKIVSAIARLRHRPLRRHGRGTSGHAQTSSEQAVRLLIRVPAGGPPTPPCGSSCRLLSSPRPGVSIVNMPIDGALAPTALLNEPHGHTLLVATAALVAVPLLRKDARYDPVGDFAPARSWAGRPPVGGDAERAGRRTWRAGPLRARQPRQLTVATANPPTTFHHGAVAHARRSSISRARTTRSTRRRVRRCWRGRRTSWRRAEHLARAHQGGAAPRDPPRWARTARAWRRTCRPMAEAERLRARTAITHGSRCSCGRTPAPASVELVLYARGAGRDEASRRCQGAGPRTRRLRETLERPGAGVVPQEQLR